MSGNVLVCDDAKFMRVMISSILNGAGWDVVGEAENGLQAVEKYKELSPDVVTMDMVMPEMGGIDALRQILKDDPSARVVMCTAMGQDALIAEAKEAGAKGVLLKPFQSDGLLEILDEVLKCED